MWMKDGGDENAVKMIHDVAVRHNEHKSTSTEHRRKTHVVYALLITEVIQIMLHCRQRKLS